ncbi:MAG: hypothetical protein H7177_05120 [Rhizobacter sp.]|nr:hypothetical protein [Bacteriovorax sp.]
MTKKKLLSLSLMTLAFCSLAVATEYKSPEVGFKTQAVPSKEMKTADFGDHYKVEDGRSNDRQIASEDEPSDRDPSSVVAKKKKDFEPEVTEEPVDAPKPWLYRNNQKNAK